MLYEVITRGSPGPSPERDQERHLQEGGPDRGLPAPLPLLGGSGLHLHHALV